MPTPIGHALAGFAAGWLVAGPASVPVDAPTSACRAEAAEPLRRVSAGPSLLRATVFAVVGMAPDLDLLVGRHSQFTHSIGAALIVFAIALLAFRRRRDALVLAAALAAAYASHPLLDWLGEDSTPPRGIMALWPFSHAYYLSHVDFFRSISREPWRPGVVWHDVVAVAREVVFLAPLAAGTWWLRRPTARAGGGRPAQNLPAFGDDTVHSLPSPTPGDGGGESRTAK